MAEHDAALRTPASGTVAGRLLTSVLIALTTVVATFATLIAPGSNYFEVLRYRLVYDAIAACALLPWLIGATVRPSWRPASKLMPAIAVCLGVYVISTATSRNVRLSVEMLGYAVLLAGMYLFLVALMRRVQLRAHFERLALVLCLLVCVIYLVAVLYQWLTWWSLLGHLAIPPLRPGGAGFMSEGPLASCALIYGAFGLATFPAGHRRWAWTLAAAVACVVVVSGSRAAWLGAVAGLAAVWPARMAVERSRIGVGFGWRWPGASGKSLMAIVIGALALAVLVTVSGRISLDLGDRASFWSASLRMFQAGPVSGMGPGVWPTLRATLTLPTEVDFYIPHAHNIFIQALAEYGLLAIPATLALFAFVGGLIRKSLRDEDQTQRLVAYAALFSIVVLVVQQLADMLVNVPAVLCAIAIPVAWLDAVALGEPGAPGGPRDQPSQPPPHPWPRWQVFGAIGIIITLGGLAAIERVSVASMAVTQEASDGEWSRAEAAFHEAADEDPSLTSYSFELGLAAANAGDLTTAEAALSASAATDDYTYAWLDLAGVRWKLGDTRGAQAALARAERLGWRRADVSLAAGWVREQLGDSAQATQDYGAALADMPALALDPFWREPARLTAWSATLDAATMEASRQGGALRDADATDLVVRLLAGETDAARAARDRLSSGQRPFYDLVIRAWTGDLAAKSELARQATAGSERSAQAWCALFATLDGDDLEARRYLALLRIDSADTAAPGGVSLPQRILFDPMAPGIPSGLDRYGSVYRRELPLAKVVGFLPTLASPTP